IDLEWFAVVGPLDLLARGMHAAGEDRLRASALSFVLAALVYAADAQLEQHAAGPALGAVDVVELQASVFDMVGQICDVEAMRSQLGFAAETGVGLWQQQIGDINGLAAIEIGVGEAAGVWSELHADIDSGAVEISCCRFCGDDAPLPFRADRLFGLA